MKCEQCEAEATIHLTRVVEGEVKKLHLCETCASDMGVDIQAPVSVTDILLNMNKEATDPVIGLASSLSCPVCFMSRADLKKTGRLGCSQCYEVFQEDLQALIKAMHHSVQHCGKVPESASKRVRAEVHAADLEVQLEKAIKDEQYEEAARLRDELQKCRRILEKPA